MTTDEEFRMSRSSFFPRCARSLLLCACFAALRLEAGVPAAPPEEKYSVFSKEDGMVRALVMGDVQAVSADGSSSFFLKTDGTVMAAGWNGDGQLGDGTTRNRPAPVPVMSGVRMAAMGFSHSLFLKTDDTVWAAGRNSDGQLGDGTKESRLTPVQVMSGVRMISVGFAHSLFLKTDGTAWGTGRNTSGHLGIGTTQSISSPARIMSGVEAVEAGQSSSFFLKTDGTVMAAGRNSEWQLGDGSSQFRSLPVKILDGVRSVSSGNDHTLFLKTDGTAWATGSNASGQLGDGTMGGGRFRPAQVMNNVTAISAGTLCSLFLRTDGTVRGCGLNHQGRIGGGTAQYCLDPAPVLTECGSMSTCGDHSLYIKTDGTVWAAGSNSFGQLAAEPGLEKLVPFQVHLPALPGSAAMVWRRGQFGAEAANPAISGWNSDPDADGIPNLLEFAFNSLPLKPGIPVLSDTAGMHGLPWIGVDRKPSGESFLVIRYLRLKNAMVEGLSYRPEFSSTPARAESWKAATANHTVESVDGVWERVTVEEPMAAPALFGRVRITFSE
ncbi:MAG: regulator of chromosome condensation [Verrucomicrobiales bacterium]|nr:regulator of chromosome condensation [Verrucomicrobiales bacterium]